jgi:hypothetical protein
MPATASERSVLDPFDPFEALPKSAEFLRELNAQFGILASRQQPTMLARNASETGSMEREHYRLRPRPMFRR